MLSTNHLLLMLSDGARMADSRGEGAVGDVLRAMTGSLVESLRHQEDIRPWRQDDLRAIYATHPAS